MKALIGYFARHPTAANLLLLIMLAAGIYGGASIRTEVLPDTELEMVTVAVDWPGAGAADVDGQVLGVIEPRMLAIDGATGTRAGAREGFAWLNVFFRTGWNMERATADVRAAIDQIGTLPPGAEVTRIARHASRDRITDIMIWGDLPLEQLSRHAIDLRMRLFEAGVRQVRLLGAPDPVIRIDIPQIAMVRHDLTLAAVAEAVRAAVGMLPVGELGEGGTRLRMGGSQRSLESIGEVVLRRTADGETLRLREVATLDLRHEHRFMTYSVAGMPAVRLELVRLPGGDALSVEETAAEVLEAFRQTVPEGVGTALARPRADVIADRLTILIDNAVIGLVLVFLFLFLFLSAGTALWVAVGIPVTMATALGLMYVVGMSLDMMSLFALIICLGIIVDDAIVVGEHADILARRGASPLEAAEQAALRMGQPVLAASLTTVIAFLALTAIGGRFGTLVLAIPLTVAMVLIASLVESFLILPAHMRHSLATHRAARWYDWPSRQVDRGFSTIRDRLFRPLTVLVMRARYAVLLGTLALMLHAVSMVTSATVPWRFFNAPEQSVLYASFSMLPGATREDAQAMVEEMRRALQETDTAFAAEHGTAPVVFAIGTVGGVLGGRLPADQVSPSALQGGMSVELIDPDRRPYPQGTFMARWAEAVRPHPRVEAFSMRGARSGPGGDPVSVVFTGQEAPVLKVAAEALKTALAPYTAIAGLEDTLPYDRAELALALNPRGEALGLTAEALGQELRARLSGIEATRFPAGPRTATVLVANPEAGLTADYPERALLRTPTGEWVPLGAVASVRPARGFATVRRQNGAPVVSVTGDLTTEDPEHQAEIVRLLEREILPEIAGRFDVSWKLTGLVEQERAFLGDAGFGFLLGLLAIYLTLAWIFGAWGRPLVVLLAIPLGFIGVVWGHHWMATPLSMFSVIGMIGMAGIVINDAIVLVTTADTLALRRAAIPAILEASADRLRPVFLTTATTVAGLAPLLFERSTQAQFLKPTVISLVFGLGFGMVLVLLVTPALLAVARDLAGARTSARRLLSHIRNNRKGFGRRGWSSQ